MKIHLSNKEYTCKTFRLILLFICAPKLSVLDISKPSALYFNWKLAKMSHNAADLRQKATSFLLPGEIRG